VLKMLEICSTVQPQLQPHPSEWRILDVAVSPDRSSQHVRFPSFESG